MSFILSQVTHTGIIMSADHCCVATSTDGVFHVITSNSVEKLFITPHDIGISHGHQAKINNMPVERYINNFLWALDIEKHKTPLEVAQALMDYFRGIDPAADIVFHVAGYVTNGKTHPAPYLYELSTNNNEIKLVNSQETVPSLAYACANKFPRAIFPFVGNKLNDFTMQEAVDFAIFITDVTRKVMELSGTGGGISKDIDILAIYPDHHEWVNKMQLHI